MAKHKFCKDFAYAKDLTSFRLYYLISLPLKQPKQYLQFLRFLTFFTLIVFFIEKIIRNESIKTTIILERFSILYNI